MDRKGLDCRLEDSNEDEKEEDHLKKFVKRQVQGLRAGYRPASKWREEPSSSDAPHPASKGS